MIKVKLYGSTMEFKSKEDAISYFKHGEAGCEGAERDRYSSIISLLYSGAVEINSDLGDM